MSDLELVAFQRVLAQTRRRIRGARGLRGLVVGLSLGLSAWLVTKPLSAGGVGVPMWLVVALACLPVLLAVGWPAPEERAAALLDRSQDDHERARAGLEYLRLPEPERSAFMQAHLRDLSRRARGWSARQAVPLRRPPELVLLLLPAFAWGLLVWLRPAAPSATALPDVRIHRPPSIGQDDLEAFQRELRALAREPAVGRGEAPELQALNHVLEALATGTLSRAEGVHALISLEHRLFERALGLSEADRSRLEELARVLAQASEPLARALRAADGQGAAQELRALSRRSAEGNRADQQHLKEALTQERARQRAEEASGAREEELESLLRKPRDTGHESAGERSLFERRERELARLRREHAERRAASRQLERLSRDLARAGESFEHGADAEAQKALEEASHELEQFADQQRDADAARQLAREVAQLRELLQRQARPPQAEQAPRSDAGHGQDTTRQEREQRFVARARGERDEQQVSLQPNPGSQQGAQGGQDEQGRQPAQQDAQGQTAQPSGETVQVLTPAGQGAGAAEKSVELVLPGGARVVERAGGSDEHGAPALDHPTRLEANHTDSAVAGVQGKGPTRSQVILDAADRGFRTAPYQKVYADYREHAESVIERDQVPAGQRFYVRRYFQLIRPRDE